MENRQISLVPLAWAPLVPKEIKVVSERRNLEQLAMAQRPQMAGGEVISMDILLCPQHGDQGAKIRNSFRDLGFGKDVCWRVV